MKRQGFQVIEVGGCFSSFKKQGEHNLHFTPSKMKGKILKYFQLSSLVLK